MTVPQLTGLHHLSAISSHAQNTVDFYAGILGLPLLKQTVNYDDPASYHLYFGDPDLQIGAMTFFVWPGANRGTVGQGGTSRVSFALSTEADLDRRASWLARHGIDATADSDADDAQVLRFEDPDGLHLEFVSLAHDSEPNSGATPSNDSVTSATAPPRLGPIDQVALIVSDVTRSRRFYGETLGLRVSSRDANERALLNHLDSSEKNDVRMNTPPVVLLQADPLTPRFCLGAGQTHHFALQVANQSGLVAWREFLNSAGVPTTEIKDRRYFQSIYFRDPDGHVLEIATTGPGFSVDEPKAQLGQHLALPPWLEDRRSEIAGRLPPLNTRPRTRV